VPFKKLNEDIKDVTLEIKRIERIRQHQHYLFARIRQKRKELARTEQILKNEKRDVDILEHATVRSLFLSILGNRKSQLEFERQEFLVVALKYKELIKSLDILEYENKVLQDIIRKLPSLEDQLDKLVVQKGTELKSINKILATRITIMDHKLIKNSERIQQIDEAIAIGDEAGSILYRIHGNLAKIEVWGLTDLYGSGKYSSYKKKSYIDKARQQAIAANLALEEFEVEVKDVYKELKIANAFQKESFEDFLHVFYENLITDWIVRRKISSVLSSIQSVIDRLNGILEKLRTEKQKLASENISMQAEKREFITKQR
jgi:hypothetical protein